MPKDAQVPGNQNDIENLYAMLSTNSDPIHAKNVARWMYANE